MSTPSLFTKPPEYTIDISCLIEIFRDDGQHTKKHYPTLWDNICDLMQQGIIISHEEVFKEIKPGDDLHKWALKNRKLFKDYAVPQETNLIHSMTAKYKDFVNAKVGSTNADPWLIVQAKAQGITVLTEELQTTGSLPKPKNMKIPDVAADPVFGVTCLNILGLIKQRGWVF